MSICECMVLLLQYLNTPSPLDRAIFFWEGGVLMQFVWPMGDENQASPGVVALKVARAAYVAQVLPQQLPKK